METHYTPISPDQPFSFSCSRKISCFNECCRDLNQFLAPYDILRLKTRLGLSSTDFLKHYTTKHTGPESGLPIIVLKTDASPSAKCPFVKPHGCSVYEDRPSSCRMYPLMRVKSRSRETAKLSEHYLLLKEGHCKGFREDAAWTIKTWEVEQGLCTYNEMNDRMLELISMKNRRAAGPLDPESKRLFSLALYDLDRFRMHLCQKDLSGMAAIPNETLDQITTDDEALLKFAFNWIRQVLFPL
ncbi:MAG: YkgJ family cysteine cluster protein [Desulfobacterales bacterium]|nr:YkgJ family cysteine cluster protein [Desulfobacterales bacterium]